MDRGVDYFLRWIERFPRVTDVAEASEQEILKYWEGLGYYARARNLHKAAKLIVLKFNAKVPCDHDVLRTLPGIGPYTAAAIASVAGNADIPVVDANVSRVFSRLFDIDGPIKSSITQKRIRAIATELLPAGKARQFNQALMDLGGLVCTPKRPRCIVCPVQKHCEAYKKNIVANRPQLAKPQKTIPVYKVCGLISWQGQFYIQKRALDGVWGGLWEFPGGDIAQNKIDEITFELVKQEIFKDCALEVDVKELLCTVQHQYTHHKITLTCYLCDLKEKTDFEPKLGKAIDYRWVLPDTLPTYAFPSGPRKIIEKIMSQYEEDRNER